MQENFPSAPPTGASTLPVASGPSIELTPLRESIVQLLDDQESRPTQVYDASISPSLPITLDAQNGSSHDLGMTPDEPAGLFKLNNLQTSNEAWKTYFDRWDKHDTDMVTGWREDLNNLLIFAGLFSAVVTTFVVDSIKDLQEDPTATANLLLTQISVQLNSFSVNGGFINSTTVPNVLSSNSNSGAQPRAVQVNILWFSSLIFSLGAASIAIIISQWLREFLRIPAGTSQEALRAREFRRQGLNNWGVPHIVAVLPILLQLALALFFIGLVLQLWSQNRLVAGVITSFVALTLLFLIVTTVLPTFTTHCPYRSPQAWAISQVAHIVPVAFKFLGVLFRYSILTTLLRLRRVGLPGIGAFDPRPQRGFKEMVRQSMNLFVFWETWEKGDIGSSKVILDHKVLLSTEITFKDKDIFETAFPRCVLDMTPYWTAVPCLEKMVELKSNHGGLFEGYDAQALRVYICVLMDLLRQSLDVGPKLEDESKAIESLLRILHQLILDFDQYWVDTNGDYDPDILTLMRDIPSVVEDFITSGTAFRDLADSVLSTFRWSAFSQQIYRTNNISASEL